MLNRECLTTFFKKGYYDLRFKTAALCVMAIVWWGLLYPELCFTEETCVQVIVTQGQEIVTEQTDHQAVLRASGDEIVVRSRFVEWLEEQKSRNKSEK